MDIKTFTASNGATYTYRVANGINYAPFGSWYHPDNLDVYNTPLDVGDKEFDDFVGLYISESDFYEKTDKELKAFVI